MARLTEDGDEEVDDEDVDGEFDEAEFFAEMVPTSLVIYLTEEFELHFATASGKYCLDGYWPSVQFTPAGTPADFTIEA